MSAASVFRICSARSGTTFLKIAMGDDAPQLRAETQRTRWLRAHGVGVPAELNTLDQGDFVAAHMSELPGSAPPDCALPIRQIVEILARGLSALHSISVAQCPFDETTAARLRRARDAIERSLIDPAHFAVRNEGLTPRQIFDRLIAAVPAHEDLVVIHGDATFDNLRIDAVGGLGFLDCGHSGRGDRYVDLECVATGIAEQVGSEWVEPFFRCYGIATWDRERALFFSDLYELF
jgi:aminoglycoside 3'-phosphotransferase-2